MSSAFEKFFLGNFDVSEREMFILKLAQSYFDRCEEYDLTVCHGQIVDGCIMPASNEETILINVNAKRVLDDILITAKNHGYTREELKQAMRSVCHN